MDGTRVDYYVHGRGRGHATRSLAVIRRLVSEGARVRVFAGRDAFGVLSVALATAQAVECQRVESLPPRPSFRSVTRMASRTIMGVRSSFQDPPDVVVSDGDHPGVVAGRALGRPVIAVGHGLIFSHCKRPAGVSRAPWLREAIKGRLSSMPSQRQVAVSFVPLEPRAPTTQVARPWLDAAFSCPARNDGSVLAYFSDGLAWRVVPLLRRVLDPRTSITLFGDFVHPGVETRPLDRPDFMSCLSACDRVVATGGSQLVSECLALEKPLFVVFDPVHDEQRLNLELLGLHGLGGGAALDVLDAGRLAAFLRAPYVTAPSLIWNAPGVPETVSSLVRELRE